MQILNSLILSRITFRTFRNQVSLSSYSIDSSKINVGTFFSKFGNFITEPELFSQNLWALSGSFNGRITNLNTLTFCNTMSTSRAEKILETNEIDDPVDLTSVKSNDVNVLIRNPIELERKKNAIRLAGVSKLQVIADFDMTLTKFLVNGRRGQSCHSLVQSDSKEVDEERKKLFEEYYPHEINPSIPFQEKFVLMDEWWEKSHNLIVKGGFSIQKIKNSVFHSNMDFREMSFELFEILNLHEIPVLIFSAGLADIIEEILRQKLHKTFSNIRVVSNRMIFDTDGTLIGFKGKVIHVLNKNEHSLELAAPMHDEKGEFVVKGEEEGSCEEEVLKRRNVILLGDHIGDLGMSDGVNCEHRITVGFLNDNVEKWKETYMEHFDIVVLNDGSMAPVIDLVKEITKA